MEQVKENFKENFLRSFWTDSVAQKDEAVASALRAELLRQQEQIELIASENIVSRAVLEAQGSVLTNKYAEGYPARRYYGGCEHVDVIEALAIERACRLFDCAYANVQPHSGSQANLCAMMALLKPGDTIMGMSLDAGGHLSHGAAPNVSGKWFRSVQYGVRADDHLIDMEALAALAREHRPQMIIAGGSAYTREIDFAAFRALADEVGAYLLVDMAHFAGLVAAGLFPSPLPHADIVTTTTHKTLRGPRGGLILSNDEALGKKINSAMFPGLQGGPLMHIIAAKAVAFGEALRPEFKTYSKAVKENAKALGSALQANGLALISGGTDSHLLLVDLRPKNITGKQAQEDLESVNITSNKNGIPNDPQPPRVCSGIRLGTPACTTRGFGVAEFVKTAELICETLDVIAADKLVSEQTRIRGEVKTLLQGFPIYDGDGLA